MIISSIATTPKICSYVLPPHLGQLNFDDHGVAHISYRALGQLIKKKSKKSSFYCDYILHSSDVQREFAGVHLELLRLWFGAEQAFSILHSTILEWGGNEVTRGLQLWAVKRSLHRWAEKGILSPEETLRCETQLRGIEQLKGENYKEIPRIGKTA